MVFSSLAWGSSHSFTNTQNIQLSGWKKKKNKKLRAWVSSMCKRGEVCDTFVQLFVHLLVIAGVYLLETSTKPLGMLTHFLTFVNPASVGQQVLAVAFLTSVDWSPLFLTLISWLTCSVDWSLGPFFLRPSGIVGNLARKPFVCVSCQNKQRNSLTGTHTQRNGCHP